MDRYAQLEKCLSELEALLKERQLWSHDMPSPEALESSKPFCVDTLAFEQWLQFVMIPRFRFMTEQNIPLPTQCDIAPMSEEVFKNRGLMDVVEAIRAIDLCINED